MNRATLSRRLFYRLVPTIFATILIAGGLSFISARIEINHSYDAQLIQSTNVLWVLLKDEMSEKDSFDPKEFKDEYTNSQLDLNDAVDDYANGRMFRIWKSGRIVMRSDTAWPKSVAKRKAGFSNVKYNGQEWRVFSFPIPKLSASIEVGEKLELRDDFVFDLLGDLSWPLFTLIPISGLLLWFGIGGGLKSVRSLVQQIQLRSPDDLAPLDDNEVPADLLPLSSSINQLLKKLDSSLDAERRFSDQVAHALRTPLAGLKLQVQMLKISNYDEVEERIEGVLSSNERAIQLVNSLLTSARISHQELKFKTIPLYETVASIVAGLGILIDKKKIDFSLQGDEKSKIETDETLFQTMMSNIIENAIKFTPEKGKISVEMQTKDKFWIISVQDTGPGIPENQKDAAFKKFIRLNEELEDGTGLGLSIVSEIANRLSAKVSLKDPENGAGLIVEIILPHK